MDSQQQRVDGCPVLSSGSTSLSPQNHTLQLQTSPFTGSRRSVISSSSVLSTVASISTPETSLQDKPTRSEEIKDIDRAALAQKFSVTRKLFETKVMEVEGGGEQVSKVISGKGIAGDKGEGGGEVSEKEEEASRKWKHAEEDGFDKDKSINLPDINIVSQKPAAQASLTRPFKSPVSDVPSGESKKSPSNTGGHVQSRVSQEEGATPTEEEQEETLNCLTPEEPVRAELVDVKNESSESDENEERERKQETNCRKDGGEKYMDILERVQDLVDDVFDEPSVEATPERGVPVDPHMVENKVDFKAGEGGSRPVFSSEERQKEISSRMPCKKVTKGDEEEGGGKYQQVNEQCGSGREEQSRQAGESKEDGDKMDESSGKKAKGVSLEDDDKRIECSQSQEATPEPQEEHDNEAFRRREAEERDDAKVGHTESAVFSGIENEAFVNDQDAQSHPEQSTPPGQNWENSLHTEKQLLEYEEIPGVPKQADQDDEDTAGATTRKVRFSSSPMKVRKSFFFFLDKRYMKAASAFFHVMTSSHRQCL